MILLIEHKLNSINMRYTLRILVCFMTIHSLMIAAYEVFKNVCKFQVPEVMFGEGEWKAWNFNPP